MSVFKVRLNTRGQGGLDINPATGVQMAESIQCTVHARGPDLRLNTLNDGQEFTASNYWKQFVHTGDLAADDRTGTFLDLVEDDGTVYVHGEASTFAKAYEVDVAVDSIFTANVVDIAGDTGSFADSATLTNNGEENVQVRINGLDASIFTLASGDSFVFENGDVKIEKIELAETAGNEETNEVQIILGIRGLSN